MPSYAAVLALLLLAACSPETLARQEAPAAGPVAGEDATVALFAGEHITGGHREAERVVALPEAGAFSKVTLTWTLSCPPNGCDPWDRIAELHLVQDDGTTIEIARVITPYGVGGTWTTDVTALQPVLKGSRRFRLFLDTWVDGWLNDVTLTYEGGVPSPLPVEVTTLWRVPHAVYGDPDRDILAAFPERAIEREEGESLQVRVLMTGHGQGNRNNCAEFCPRTHSVLVGGDEQLIDLWRGDCDQNPVSKQKGNWQFPRAGWCPGADVIPWTADVTGSVPAGQSTPISLYFEEYVNTCRPGVSVCQGCAGGGDCNYNDSGHTEPFYDVSVQLIRSR